MRTRTTVFIFLVLLGIVLSRGTLVRMIDDGNGRLTIVVAVGNIGSQMWINTRRTGEKEKKAE